jgi:glycosyltransferase involved in cell wall biosynthesis
MKLLVFTQAVDRDDLFLGFFHAWIEELAKHFEKVSVVCLKEGKHSLPKNVEVYSLGKENGTSRLTRAWRVLTYSYKLRHDYDRVFVHMNQEYILLAGWLWKRLKKPVYLWRNHYAGNWLTDQAAGYCTKIFCTSKYSYTAKFPKVQFMLVGVSMDKYKRMPEVPRAPRSILFYARMAPSKNPGLLLEALSILHKKSVPFSADLYGNALPQDQRFLDALKLKSKEYGLGESVRFLAGKPHEEGPAIFNAYEIFVNASRSGMYDKTLLEAAACECIVVSASKDFGDLVPPEFTFEEGNAQDLAKKLEPLLTLPLLEQQGLGSKMHNIAQAQSLEVLGKTLASAIMAK